MSDIKKFDEISCMRSMAMIMIIGFHSLCFYNGRWAQVGAIDIPFWHKTANFLDAIDLNMFVFISGYLFGYLYLYKNKYAIPFQVFKNKVVRLLIPYCFWGLFMVTVFSSIYPYQKLLFGVSHLWFLIMLFGVFCIMELLLYISFEKISQKKFFISLLLFYSIWYINKKWINPDDFLCITRMFYYMPAFLIGFYCAKKRVAWLMSGPGCFMLPTAMIVLYACCWHKLPLPYGLVELLKTCCGYIICVSLLIILSKVWLNDTKRFVIHQIEHLSMGIYIFNQIAMDAVLLTPFLNHWFREHWMVGPFLLFILGFFPPMALSYLFNKYSWLRWTIGG